MILPITEEQFKQCQNVSVKVLELLNAEEPPMMNGQIHALLCMMTAFQMRTLTEKAFVVMTNDFIETMTEMYGEMKKGMALRDAREAVDAAR